MVTGSDPLKRKRDGRERKRERGGGGKREIKKGTEDKGERGGKGNKTS